ncbi:MAG TPA: hypothetical protein VFI31_13435 [Pirellulales bacterium]|nr:hypothetical protein [Pirellulales bacterium]
MQGDEAVVAVIDALDALGVEYMVVGSLSSNFYGVPRSTEDADIVVELGSISLLELIRRLGPEFRLEPQASFETITMTTRHILKVPSSDFTIELFQLSENEHDRQRFQRRRQVSLHGRAIVLPTAEDVIVTKLFWALTRRHPKDREDVRDVIAVQDKDLDWAYINSWADRQGTRALLEEIRGEIPPGA